MQGSNFHFSIYLQAHTDGVRCHFGLIVRLQARLAIGASSFGLSSILLASGQLLYMIPMILGVGVQCVFAFGANAICQAVPCTRESLFFHYEVTTLSWVYSLRLLITMWVFPDARERDLEEVCVLVLQSQTSPALLVLVMSP